MTGQSKSKYVIVVLGSMKSGRSTYLANILNKRDDVHLRVAIRRFRVLQRLFQSFDYLCEQRFQIREEVTLPTLTVTRLRYHDHCFTAKKKLLFCRMASDAFCAENARTSAVLERIAGALRKTAAKHGRNSGVRNRQPNFPKADAARLSPHQIYAPGVINLIVLARIKRRLLRICKKSSPDFVYLVNKIEDSNAAFQTNRPQSGQENRFLIPPCRTGSNGCRRHASHGQFERSGLSRGAAREKDTYCDQLTAVRGNGPVSVTAMRFSSAGMADSVPTAAVNSRSKM